MQKNTAIEKKPIKTTEKLPGQNIPIEEGKSRFYDLGLNISVLRALNNLKFQYCTPIQAEILPHILMGHDAIGRAQTGTGKTAAFLICIFSHLLKKNKSQKRSSTSPRALILAPTRELAIQIEKEALQIGQYTPFNSMAAYGGMDYKKQRAMLTKKKIDVLIATPGRLLDYHRSKSVFLNNVEILVIDEADRMLDMGFIPDVRRIVHATPYKDKRQTLFFSATLNNDVLRLAEQWTKGAKKVEVESEQVAAKDVHQLVYLATQNEKLLIVNNLLQRDGSERVLIFCNRRDRTRELCKTLKGLGFSCSMLSGEIDQSKRIKTLEQFRNGKINVLVATDVAGRGLHVEGVSHVINYDLPEEAEDYVHRIGRTGRAGETGTSISFACEADAFHLPDIEILLGHALKCEYPDEALLKPLPVL